MHGTTRRERGLVHEGRDSASGGLESLAGHPLAGGRSLREVLEDTHQVHRQFLAVIDSLPEKVQIDEVLRDRACYLVWVDDKRFPVGEFFDHLHDDHEPDIRAWLAREDLS